LYSAVILLGILKACVGVEECGNTWTSPLDHGFIVGGSEATPHSIPWQISLGFQMYDYDLGHTCGGSIVSRNYVVTAAHCLTDLTVEKDRKWWYVVAVAHSLTEKDRYEQRVKVEKFIIHPGYDDNDISYNDIALLKLETPLYFDDGVQPICMPEASQAWDVSDTFLVSGWGSQLGSKQGTPLESDLSKNPDRLQQVLLPYFDHEKCAKLLSYRRESIHDKVICTGYEEGGRDTCAGDSGGPLATKVNGKWTLAGVVSWGVGCARANRPGVYTDVAKYRSWIDKHV